MQRPLHRGTLQAVRLERVTVKIRRKKIVEMPSSGIRKFFDIVTEMPDAISLGVGEPDFVTPWHIRDAGIYSLEKGFTKYTSNAGMAELRREKGWTQKDLAERLYVSDKAVSKWERGESLT